MDWLSKLLGKGLVEPVADYFQKRMELREARRIRKMEIEDAMHQRKVELISKGLAADATWEIEQIRNSGWKDEWVLVILSIPLVGCFVPHFASYVLAGFSILSQTPDWYQWLILIVFTAIYGIRIWRRQQYDTP